MNSRDPGTPDPEHLAELLTALGSPNRLRLVTLLREPRTLDEIELPPTQQIGDREDRAISRQAVEKHLDRLAEFGLVREEETTRKGSRPRREFVVDRASLFAVLEELRRLGALEPEAEVDPRATVDLDDPQETDLPPGRKLVLVRGAREGVCFPLRRSKLEDPRGWILGRSADAHVSLEYDPYVSKENAEVIPSADGPKLVDLRSSTNGTFLNWTRLEPGEETPLSTGDVVGVGRSLLVYHDD
jgi:DNA-binding transcriptional ArsR family regulator